MVSKLSEAQIREFKQKLQERFEQLRQETRQILLRSDDEHYIDLAGKVHDLEEESVANLLVDLDLAEIDWHVQEIRDIEAALMRIQSGTYGVCADCVGPIDVARLQVYPTAKRCHRCQERYEKSHVQVGHPSL